MPCTKVIMISQFYFVYQFKTGLDINGLSIIQGISIFLKDSMAQIGNSYTGCSVKFVCLLLRK